MSKKLTTTFSREKVEELIKWMADNVTLGDNQHYVHKLYGGKKKLFTEQLLREFETGNMDSRTF